MLLVLCLLLLHSHSASGNFGDVVRRCCWAGSTAAPENFTQSCSNQAQRRANSESSSLRGVCRRSFSACCLHERRRTACLQGRREIQQGDSCDISSPLPEIRHYKRSCCECCWLGLEARKDGLTCTFGRQFEQPCRASFESCCSSATTTVVDRDECGCSHYCPQTVDTRRCSCAGGFRLMNDGKKCKPISVLAPRGQCTDETCEHECTTRDDKAECTCFDGFALAADRRSCEDVNECLSSPCPSGQTCENRIGSYDCYTPGQRCPRGHRFNSYYNQCKDIDECATGEHNCRNGYRCENSVGTFQCRRSISCGTGYTINSTTQMCEDINECALDPPPCQSSQRCVNEQGSYRCHRQCQSDEQLVNGQCQKICQTGFIYQGARCVDIDECLENRPCPEGDTCVNTQGGYLCQSRPRCVTTGYVYNDTLRTCVDINECIIGVNGRRACGANQNCYNRPGTFVCQCYNGYELVDNTCVDRNECERNPCSIGARCTNTLGSFECSCLTGYKRVSSYTCEPIDPCEEERPCQHLCKNSGPGRYQCSCRTGYQLASDLRHCEDIDECVMYGRSPCQGICVNTVGSYTCRCHAGLRAISAIECEDIDECAERTTSCNANNQVCTNIYGSYRCARRTCPENYNLLSKNPGAEHQLICQRDRGSCQTYLACSPTSITYDFRSLPPNINLPVTLFRFDVSIDGPHLFTLEVEKAENPETGLPVEIDRSYFMMLQSNPNNSRQRMLRVVRELPRPVDVHLKVKIDVYNTQNQYRGSNDFHMLLYAYARITES